MTKKKEDRVKILVRFEHEIYAAIDEWRKRREREMPGFKISTNAAINALCAKAAKK